MNSKALIEKQRLRRQRLHKNLGFTDRQIRALIGTLMLAVPVLTVTGTLGMWAIVMLASIPVLTTAIMGWDPIYALMDKSTYDDKEEDIQQRHWTYANIGIIDRVVRFGVGSIMLAALMGTTTVTGGTALTLLAIPLIMTALTAWDPLYAATGKNSFVSRFDIEAAEPGVSGRTLTKYYEFPQPLEKPDQYSKAA